MNDQQKYFTEVSLLQATKGVMLVKPAELEKIASQNDMHPALRSMISESHIYFVCQRPRVRIAEAGNRSSEGVRFTLDVSSKDGTDIRDLIITDQFLPPEATGAKIYENGNYFALTKGSENLTRFMPPESLLAVTSGFPELTNLEIVYIGQAFGDEGKRTVIDRLKSHSTLQKVLAKHAHTSWWMEPIILLFTYGSPQLILKMDGQGYPDVTEDDDLSHFKSIMDEPLSDAELITVAEASLIRYFQPQYNIHFKGNYPTTQMLHLQEAYRLDYNAIITEIDTEDVFVKTFSEQQKPRYHHIAQFDLHDTAERLSFFEL